MSAAPAKKSSGNFPVLATICAFLGFIVLCSLGGWQIQRLEWKKDVLEKLDKAYEVNPLHTPVSIFDMESANSRGRDYFRGFITGNFDYDAEVLVGPRTYKGLSGYHLITPMRLATGDVVIVNRGWVPAAKKNKKDRPESLIPGPVPMGGLFRKPDTGSLFTPANDPASGNWYTINIDEIAKRYKLQKVAPYVLYVEQIAPQPYNYPLPQDTDIRPNNNHLHYAIFWFFMAGLLLFLYWLRFLKPIFAK